MFTDPENRHAEELMREIEAQPVGGDPSFGQKIRVLSGGRSLEEQERLRKKYLSRHPEKYANPGHGDRHA